jgi:peptidoglycan/LPS O-acetylase OafA/YrhL
VTKEIKTLTGLRGVAAIVVMLYHFFEDDTYFAPYVPSLIKHGYLAVDVFFILSGFVMALSYAHYFKDGVAVSAFRTFMVKRVARIYPLYMFITLACVLRAFINFSGTGSGGVTVDDFIASALMYQAWGFGFSNIAGATWSISVEFFAYILFPLLVYFAVFGRVSYALVLCALAALAIYVVASSHLGVSGQLDVVSPASTLPLVRCLAGFCLGLATYRVAQSEAGRRFLSSSWFIIGVVFALLLAAHLQMQDVFLFWLFPPVVAALYFESIAAKAIFANRVVYHLGVVSYSIYLAHPLLVPVPLRLEPIAERIIGGAAHPVTLIFALFLTWGVSYWLYRFIEKPSRIHIQNIFLHNRGNQSHLPPNLTGKNELVS